MDCQARLQVSLLHLQLVILIKKIEVEAIPARVAIYTNTVDSVSIKPIGTPNLSIDAPK